MTEWASLSWMSVRGPDKWASQGGAYHAARSRDGRSRQHEGVDLVCPPHTPIYAPEACIFDRIADPYPDSKDGILLGCVLALHAGGKVKILYMEPTKQMKAGMMLTSGTLVGFSQSLQHLYPGITDHVHLEYYNPSGERVDPTLHIFGPPTQPPTVTA